MPVPTAAVAAAAPLTVGGAARVALIGNPNTGKTTLFNRLCGARAKTSNFPGTTTSRRTGTSRLTPDRSVAVIDLPGLYELQSDVPETRIARDVLRGADVEWRPDVNAVVVDATNLPRNLLLVGELLAHPTPVVVALNMTDLAARQGLSINVPALAAKLGVPVVPMAASKGLGVEEFRGAVTAVLAHGGSQARVGAIPPSGAPAEDLVAWADAIARDVVSGGIDFDHAHNSLTERLDRFLTHPVFGTLVFLAVMGTLFWTLFAIARIPMALIDTTFSYLSSLVSRFLPEGPVRGLLIDGVIGGIAGMVVFLPQICLLFFLISLLEDTGYLARAAFVNDRFFQRFGLPGQAFVPLLSSHACALPGIMSTRLIQNRRDRLVTIMVAPFMSCSARLPVYVLLTNLLFASHPILAGPAFAACYMLGATAAFSSAWLFGRTILPGRARPMVLELPTYRVPSLMNALLAAKDQGLAFLKTAGTVIMAICVVMWWLSAYPHAKPSPEAEALRAQAAASITPPAEAERLTKQADAIQAKAQQTGSIIGHVGRAVEPVFRPLGYDWQLTVGILTSFLAREVFVSTMSVLAGNGGDEGVITHIRTMTRDDGSLVFTLATAASALIFFVLAMQCLPTLVVTRRESGSVKFAVLQFAYMSGVAWMTSCVVYQTLRAFGVP